MTQARREGPSNVHEVEVIDLGCDDTIDSEREDPSETESPAKRTRITAHHGTPTYISPAPLSPLPETRLESVQKAQYHLNKSIDALVEGVEDAKRQLDAETEAHNRTKREFEAATTSLKLEQWKVKELHAENTRAAEKLKKVEEALAIEVRKGKETGETLDRIRASWGNVAGLMGEEVKGEGD